MKDENRGGRLRGRRILSAGLAMLGLGIGLAAPVLAVDGVIEINQAKALAGGVSTGDFPGFPITITEPGSYRLTGDLSAPPGVNGFLINVDDVSLDLNGFNLNGGGGAIADGIGFGTRRNVEIRNGTVRGFSRHGIFGTSTSHYARAINVRVSGNTFTGMELQGHGNLVDGCTAHNNNVGIRALDGSLVVNSVMRDNNSFGLSLSSTTGYRSNVITNNNGGNANAQVAGVGLQLGSNVCGSGLVCP